LVWQTLREATACPKYFSPLRRTTSYRKTHRSTFMGPPEFFTVGGWGGGGVKRRGREKNMLKILPLSYLSVYLLIALEYPGHKINFKVFIRTSESVPVLN
jgi:hypothetical protein